MDIPGMIVFTDLDGTLLDHHSYDWSPARPALERLAAAGIPVILNSSKTASEIKALRREMGNTHPYIVENGAAVVIPANRLGRGPAHVQSFGIPREEVCEQLEQLRAQGFYFRGFADMTTEELSGHTGLAPEDAERARQRYATEPLLWLGDEESLEQFRKLLARAGLRLLKGGRFWHAMGGFDKSDGVRFLLGRYQALMPRRNLISIALGDSPNDQQMLAAADVAVVLPGAGSDTISLPDTQHVIRPDKPGPTGWNQAMLGLLETYGF